MVPSGRKPSIITPNMLSCLNDTIVLNLQWIFYFHFDFRSFLRRRNLNDFLSQNVFEFLLFGCLFWLLFFLPFLRFFLLLFILVNIFVKLKQTVGFLFGFDLKSVKLFRVKVALKSSYWIRHQRKGSNNILFLELILGQTLIGILIGDFL